MEIEIKRYDTDFGIAINGGDQIGGMEPTETGASLDWARDWFWSFRPHGTDAELTGEFEGVDAEMARRMLRGVVEAAHTE